jgi:hypothetical protein
MNGTSMSFSNLNILGNYINGSSPTTADTATGFFAVDGAAALNVAAWAFSPPGVTPTPTTTETFIELRSFTEHRRFSNGIRS